MLNEKPKINPDSFGGRVFDNNNNNNNKATGNGSENPVKKGRKYKIIRKKGDKSNKLLTPKKQKKVNLTGKRVVFSNNKREKQEKKVVTYIPYGQFLKQKAEESGMKERKGRLIDSNGKIDDGYLCEEAILGRCYDYIGRMEQVPVPLYGMNKIEKKKAKEIILDFVRKHQPPRESMPLISKSILQMIDDKARLFVQNKFIGTMQIKRINLFTAVGTPLDFRFGVDGWIEIETNDGHMEIITFDLKTGNSEKLFKDFQANLIMEIKTDYTEIAKQKKKEFKIAEKTVEELGRFVEKTMDIYKDRLQRLGFK